MEEVKFEDTQDAGLAEKAKELAATVVGMTLDAAIQAITGSDCEHRISEENGESKGLTMDYRTDRVNLVIEDGKVTDANVG